MRNADGWNLNAKALSKVSSINNLLFIGLFVYNKNGALFEETKAL